MCTTKNTLLKWPKAFLLATFSLFFFITLRAENVKVQRFRNDGKYTVTLGVQTVTEPLTILSQFQVAPGQFHDFSYSEADYVEGYANIVQKVDSSSTVGNSLVAGSGFSWVETGVQLVLPGIGISINQVPYGYIPFNAFVNPETSKTVWVVDDTTLTADLFREGVDKIVAFQGGASGATTSSAGMTLNEYQNQTHTEDVHKGVNAIANQSYERNSNREIVGMAPGVLEGMVQMGTEKAQEVFDLVNNAAPSPPTVDSTPTFSSFPTFNASVLGNTVSFTLSPSVYGLSDIGSFTRQMLIWITGSLFFMRLWHSLFQVVVVTSLTQNTKGNQVMGSGGQITSTIAAVAITAVILSVYPIFWTLISEAGYGSPGSFGIGFLPSAFDSWMALLQFFVPVGYIMTIFGYSLLIEPLKAKMVLLVAGAVRFINP